MKAVICYLFTLILIFNSFAQTAAPITKLFGIPDSLCQNNVISPSAGEQNACTASPGGNTYYWTFVGGTPSSSTAANPLNIYYNTAGTFAITCKSTNACGSNTIDTVIRVVVSPSLSSNPANINLCSGIIVPTQNFTSTTPGTAFWWENNNTNIGLGASGGGPSNAIASFTLAAVNSVENATIKVHPFLGACNGPVVPFTVQVTRSPLAPSSPNINYCQYATAVSLNAPVTSGNTLNWYTVSTGGSGTSTAPTPVTSTPGITNYYVSQINTISGCESPRDTIAVTVFAQPVIGQFSYTNPTNCSSSTGTITLGGLTANTTYALTYNSTVAGTTTAVASSNLANAAGNILITGLAASTISGLSIALNNCSSTTKPNFTLTDPLPPNTPTVSNSTITVCAGVSINLAATSTSSSSTNPITYSWSGPSLYASANQNPVITNSVTTQTGSYNVVATQNSCTTTPTTVNVTVNAVAAAPVAASSVNFCQYIPSSALNATAVSGNTLLWYADPTGGLGAVTSPKPATNITGTTLFYVSQINSVTSCESPRTSIPVTINVRPAFTAMSSTNTTACNSYTGSMILGGLNPNITYTVQYSSTINSVTTLVSADSISDANGKITIINLHAAKITGLVVKLSSCFSDAWADFIISDPTPPTTPTVVSNVISVCAGTNINLSAASTSTTANPITYLWSGVNNYSSNSQSPVIINAVTAETGNYTVVATQNSCASAPTIIAVTVNAVPATPIITTNTPVCSGNNVNFNTSNGYSSDITYSWTGPSFTSTNSNPVLSNSTPTNSGVYSLIVTDNTTGCTSSQSSATVVINPTPVISAANGTNPQFYMSATGVITLQGLTVLTTYSVSYSKDYGAAVVQSLQADNSGNILITNLVAGVYRNILCSLNGCNSGNAANITLTNPTQITTPQTSSNLPLCTGGNLKLYAIATSGSSNPITYAWTGPNNFLSTDQNPIITNAGLLLNGVYTVTAQQNGFVTPQGSINITIYETPTTPIIYNSTPVCSNEALSLSFSTSYTGTVNYTWSGPNNWQSSVQSPVLLNAAVGASGTYQLIITSTTGQCASATASKTILINATPYINGISATNTLNCGASSGSITLSGLLINTAYQVTYTKNSGITTITSLTTAGDGTLLISNLSAGVYTSMYVSLNNCPSNTIGAITLSDPAPPSKPVGSSNSPVCSNNTLNLFTNSTSASTNNISYSWTGANGFTSTQQNPTITAVTTNASGSYTPTATQNSCVVVGNAINIIINQSPLSPNITNNSVVCSGNALNLYGSTSFIGAASYAWTGPGNFTATVQNPIIAVATVSNTGIYGLKVTSATGNCSSPVTSTVITITPSPVIGAFSSVNPSNCNTATGSISLTGLNNSTAYQVNYLRNSIVNTATLNSDANGIILINNLSAASYTNIVVTLNNCSSNSIGPITLQDPSVPVTPVITVNSPNCIGTTVQFMASTTTTGTLTYSWNGPNSFQSTINNPVISNAQPNSSGAYQVTVSQNSCISAVATVNVVINPVPAAPAVVSPLTYCVNNIAQPLIATVSSGNTLKWYTAATGGSATFTPFTPTTTTAGSTNYYVSQLSNSGCEGGRSLITVTINNNPIAKFIPTATTNCGIFNLTNSIIGLQQYPANNSQYNWYANGASIGTGTIFPGYTLPQNSMVTIKLVTTTANGCAADSMSQVFSAVQPYPAFSASVVKGCGPLKVSFTNTTPNNAAFSYYWDFGNGQTANTYQPAAAVTYSSNPVAGTDSTYLIQLTVNSICGPAIFTRSVYVPASPVAAFTTNSSESCSATKTFTNISKGTSNTYSWDFGDGIQLTTTATGAIQHTYTSTDEANYVVTLVASNSCGSNTKTVAVKFVPNIIAVTLSNSSASSTGCTPYTVLFKKTAVGSTNFLWNFGDGNTLNTIVKNENVVHTYLTAGNFTVSVNATNACTQNTAQNNITSLVSPLADFTIGKTTFCRGDSQIFTNKSILAANYQWNFGDGITASTTNPTHVYAATGLYQVKLVTIANTGCKDSMMKPTNIIVNNVPVVNIIAPSIACTKQGVLFNTAIQSVDMLTIMNWQISTATINTGTSLNYSFVTPGTYVVNFIAGTQNGCYDTASKIITVSQSPVVNAGADVILCNGKTTQLQATGGPGYQWSPVTGLSCTTCANPVATPLITSLYKVVVTNSAGCSVADSVQVTVIPPMQLTITGSNQICIGQSTNLQVTGGLNYIWTPATGLSSTIIYNPIATPLVTTTYQVTSTDAYNCFTATANKTITVGLLPIINLGADVVSSTGSSLPLSSIIINGPITNWLWTPATGLDCYTCALPTAYLKKDITYTVTVTNNYGCTATDNINIKVFCKNSQVFVPNAFTPDGDGINDVLMVRAQGILRVKSFIVYNRFGQIVFEKNNFAPNIPSLGWDGRVNGKMANTEVYIYTAEVICENGLTFTYKGNTTLIN